jgi:hypothetical protein
MAELGAWSMVPLRVSAVKSECPSNLQRSRAVALTEEFRPGNAHPKPDVK